MKQKSPHERRQHAAGVSVVATAIIAMGWLASLGYSASTAPATVAKNDGSDQLASAIAGIPHVGGASLEVSTTSVYSTQN